jgi:DNA-binding IclR family transcriptional regulator
MSQVRSIRRAIHILDALGKTPSLSAADLCRTLRAPKSSTYEILSTLAAEGLVEKVDGEYRVGLRVEELARAARRDRQLGQAARPVIQRLRDELDETVQLTVRDGEEILYVEGSESSRQLRTFFEFGDRAPLHCTALGKAILAFLPPAEAARILRRPSLRAFTPRTLTDPAALARDLARTAARGYSIDDGEHEEGVRCVGAPIRNRDGVVFASLSVSGPTHRVSPARDADIARRVVAAAGEISRRLGWLPQGGAGRRAVPRGKPIRHAKGGAAAADRIRDTGSRRLPSSQKRR